MNRKAEWIEKLNTEKTIRWGLDAFTWFIYFFAFFPLIFKKSIEFILVTEPFYVLFLFNIFSHFKDIHRCIIHLPICPIFFLSVIFAFNPHWYWEWLWHFCGLLWKAGHFIPVYLYCFIRNSRYLVDNIANYFYQVNSTNKRMQITCSLLYILDVVF